MCLCWGGGWGRAVSGYFIFYVSYYHIINNILIHVLHINYSGPGGVTVRNKILSKGGFRRKKEGMSNILKIQLFLTICAEKNPFCLEGILSMITFKALIPMSG